MRILKLILLLLVMVIGAAFTVMNAETVPFNYYFGRTEAPLSLVLVVALGLGVLLGILAGLGILMEVKMENAALRRKARLAAEEVNNLRSIPLKDK